MQLAPDYDRLNWGDKLSRSRAAVVEPTRNCLHVGLRLALACSYVNQLRKFKCSQLSYSNTQLSPTQSVSRNQFDDYVRIWPDTLRVDKAVIKIQSS